MRSNWTYLPPGKVGVLQDLGFSSVPPRRNPVPGTTLAMQSHTFSSHPASYSPLASRISTFLDLFCSLLCFCTADLFPMKIFNHLGARCHPSDLPSSWFDLYSLYFVQQTQSSEILISLGTGPGSSPLWFCGQRTRLPRPLMGL